MKKLIKKISVEYNFLKKFIYDKWVHINVYVVFIMVLAGIVNVHYASNIFELVKAIILFSLAASFWVLLNYFRR